MILVTGGTGLLGSHLLFELVQNGATVRAIYRSKDRIQKTRLLFDYYSQGKTNHFDNIEWVEGDVLDLVSLEDAMDGVDHVYHCAAKVSFRKRDFKELIHTNRVGTANVVNMALKFGVKKLGYISSTAAIGGVENKLTTEQTKWTISNKTSGYAISKYNAEREVWRGTEEGLDCIIVNPCLIFGAGDWNESSLSIFQTVKKGLKFYSPGSNAYVDARDVSSCLIQLMNSETKNERYLLIGHNMSFKDSLIQIAKQMGVKAPNSCPPKWIALLLGRTSELMNRLFNAKSAITLESARSAYSTMRYSNEKVVKETNHTFHSFEATVQNVLDFETFTSKK